MLTDTVDIDNVEIRLKILIIGPVFSGKTSFIERYVNNKFNKAYKPTIGVDFGMKSIQWDCKTKIKLQLWDLAGQDRYMTRIYYRNALGCLILFDINCPKSFLSVIKFKKEIDDKVMLPNGKPIPCLLVANKCDVDPKINLNDKPLPSLGQFCRESGFCGYYLTSAKEGININESVHFVVEKIINDKEIIQNLLKKKTISKEIKIEKKPYIRRGCC